MIQLVVLRCLYYWESLFVCLQVVSAVATYFIVMLQLLQPHTQSQYQPTTTTTPVPFNVTDDANFTTLDPTDFTSNTLVGPTDWPFTTIVIPTNDPFQSDVENSTVPSLP